MTFNQYQVYAVISSTEDKKNSKMKQILPILDKLESVRAASAARKILEDEYNITEDTRQFYINNEYPVTISDTSNVLSIGIVVNDENLLFCYRKEF